MNSKLIILAVLVTVTRGYLKIPCNFFEDFSDIKHDALIVEASKQIVDSSFDKFSKSMFHLLIKLAKENYEDLLLEKDESSGVLRVNMDPERVTFAMQLEAILITMLNLRPQARLEIFAAQKAATIIDERLIDYLGEAIAVARRRNSPGTLERINYLEELTQRSPEPYNAAVFGTFKICVESPEIIAMINKNEIQANIDYHKVIRYFYNAIRAVVFTNGTCDIAVLYELAEQKLLIDNYYDDSVNVEFNLIKMIYKSVEKPEPKNEDEGIKWTEIYSYSNATENCSCYSSEDSSDSSVANQNQTANSYSDIGALQNIAINYIKECIVLIFDTIRTEANKAANGTSCKHEYNEPVTEMSKMKEYMTLKSELDVKLNAALIAQPEASKIADNVRQTIYSRLSDMLTGVKCGTDLIAGKYSSGIPKRMEKLQNDTVSAAIDVCDNVYMVVMNGRNSSSAMGKYMTASRKKADSILVQLFETVFTAIKLVLSRIFPTMHFENFECSSSLESLENKASSEFVSVVETIFVAINSTVKRNCRCECVNAVNRTAADVS